jgi:hypothetical protein
VRKLRILLVLLIIAAAVTAAIGLLLARKAARYQVKLADGSTFTLKQVTLTATNLSYSHDSRGPFLRLITPILPAFILQKFPSSGGSFGFGSDGNTNLIIITDLKQLSFVTRSVSINRLRISDGTNNFDACWGAHTLGYNNEIVNGWTIRAFPRRGPDLLLEFLSFNEGSTNWDVAARFKIPNPAPGQFPQWEPGPSLQTNENLQVRLAMFNSGARLDHDRNGSDFETLARKTVMHFAFEEDGHPTEDWRVQKVIISDATGNKWFPYLDLETQRFTWARGGRVEFFGALWPGEYAWQLDVELSRVAGLGTDDLFTLETALPGPATVNQLTNTWSHGGTTVTFVALASPNTDHTGSLQWTGKWWGEDKDKVYSLVLTAKPDLQKQRLHLLSAADQNGTEVKLLEHRGQDYSDQGLFLRPERTAEKIKLIFSLTRSKFVQFRARPEFLGR